MTPKKRAKAKVSKTTRAPKAIKAQDALRLSEERFRTLFENVPVLIDGFDKNGRCVLWNNECEKVFGWTLEEINFHDEPLALFYPDPAIRKEVIKAVISKPERVFREWHPVTKDGKERMILWANFQLPGGAVINIGHDITERKQAEEEIRVLSKFPGENPNPVMRVSRDGTLLYINEAGMNLLTEYHLQIKKKVPPMFHRVVLQSLNSRLPREMDIEQGNRLYSFFIAPIVDAGYANLYGHDITKRKKIENILQKQHKEQQIILDSVPAGIFYKDKENRYIRVNKIFAEVMEMTKKQLEGKSIFDLHPKESAEAYWRDDKEVMASGQPKRNIVEPPETKKGSLWVQTDKIPYRDAQGNIIGIIGFTIDITERRQAETELKESHEQLRILARHLQKDREIERARIAKELHDELGQTLTAIKIDYACLQKKLGLLQKPLREEVKDLSGLIDTTINTVRQLTMDLRPAMLDDLGLIPAVEWMIKGVQKRAGIKSELTVKPSHLKLGPDLSLTIFRIIQEALTNIIRYAQATRVWIILEKGSDGLNLTIKDNGIGIHQKQIKNPYSLGLVGMRERVIFHDGKIEITGETNKGTTITVFFPPLKKGKNENTDS